ncbi:NAD(P)/FAD-dependent oxidoreductase [Streptomyces sp. NPDC002519]
MHAPQGPSHGHALVVGGGLAGMLAAAALSHHGVTVDVFEAHDLPTVPAPRKGLPQGRHVHVLMSGGARAIDVLLPGTIQRLVDAGARRIPLPTGMVGYSPEGWYRRWTHESQYVITVSRDLLDHVVRAAVRADSRVTVHTGARVTALLGTGTRVTGAVHASADGAEKPVHADLVVDASGRGTRTPHWLVQLGMTGPPEDRVDSGLAYASRTYRSPVGDADWPIVSVQADSRQPQPGRAGTIVPIEDGRWLVSLSGTRDGQPTNDPDDFLPFARRLRHPLVADLIAKADPLTGVTLNRSTANERRRYEKLRTRLEGLVVLGDAVAAYNPVYGHGMSVAAQAAVALREEIARGGLRAPGLARRAQIAIARPVDVAWMLATGQDVQYRHTTGRSPTLIDRVAQLYAGRLSYVATGREDAAVALTEVTTLNALPSSLFRTRTLWAALRGPLRPPLEGPRFTEKERALLGRAIPTD